MAKVSRRKFLETAVALGATAAWGSQFAFASTVDWKERRDLFPEGVASGDPDSHSVLLWTRRAPIVRDACTEAFGPAHDDSHVMSLRTLLGVIGAHQWYIKGVEIPAAGGRIHPCYGVFAPIRSEYLDLVSSAPLPGILSDTSQAFDIGTGTGVIAAGVMALRFG